MFCQSNFLPRLLLCELPQYRRKQAARTKAAGQHFGEESLGIQTENQQPKQNGKQLISLTSSLKFTRFVNFHFVVAILKFFELWSKLSIFLAISVDYLASLLIFALCKLCELVNGFCEF